MSNFTPSRQLIERLAAEIRISGQQGLIPSDKAVVIADALLAERADVKVQLTIPGEVGADIRTHKADLSYARCTSCGRAYNLDARLLKSLKCPCGGSLVPAPLWVIASDAKKPPAVAYQAPIKLVYSVEDYLRARELCQGAQAPDEIRVRDRSRPIFTLEFKCGTQTHEPEYIHYARVFRYLLSLMPSESITKPVTVTAFAYDRSDCVEVNVTAGPLAGVLRMLYCSDLEVLQATPLYIAGHPRSSSSARIAVFDEPQFSGANVINVPVRYIRTRGLVVELDADSIERVLRDLNYYDANLWVALHTVSHSFLTILPRITGLEGGDFGEAISTNTNEIAVYDNSPGGLGGVEGVVDTASRVLMPNYEWAVRESHRCPLVCTKACKACLYTDACYMLNWRLDRRILERLGW